MRKLLCLLGLHRWKPHFRVEVNKTDMGTLTWYDCAGRVCRCCGERRR